MNYKIVINKEFGGFGLSKKALDLYSKYYEELTGVKPQNLNGGYNIARHDPLLVRVVEELGSKKASSNYAKLEIEEISGKLYRIEEYDGLETIKTPGYENWTVIDSSDFNILISDKISQYFY